MGGASHHDDDRYAFFIYLFDLTHSRWTSSLPSCLWSLRIFPSLPDSRLTAFYRDTSSAILQFVNQWLNFYLLTFPRFPLRKKEHKSYFSKNRTYDFRTSRCAGYLLDHSGDERLESFFLPKHLIFYTGAKIWKAASPFQITTNNAKSLPSLAILCSCLFGYTAGIDNILRWVEEGNACTDKLHNKT